MTEVLSPMPSFAAVLFPRGTHAIGEVLRVIDATAASDLERGTEVLVAAPWSPSAASRVEVAAARASEIAGEALAISAVIASDEYALTQFERGHRTRRIAFHRDADETAQWELEGAAQDWETDLLFSLPADEFVAYLSDDDSYSDAELVNAKAAHEAGDLRLLARRPPLLAASLWEWLAKKNLDPRTPSASFRRHGFWRRVFAPKWK